MVFGGMAAIAVAVIVLSWGDGSGPNESTTTGASTIAEGETGSTTEPTTTTTAIEATVGYPGPLQNSEMVFHPALGGVVMFGGRDAGATTGETWVYDVIGDTWREATGTLTPSPRLGFGMAFIESTDEVVVIGGSAMPIGACSRRVARGAGPVDVWFLDASLNWRHGASPEPPSDRWGQAIAAVPDSEAIVLFGGTGTEFDRMQSELLGDTWIYTPSDGHWRQVSTGEGPEPRLCARMAADAATGLIYLWGGVTESQAGDPTLWAFDPQTETWQVVAVTGESPGARWLHQLVYEPESKLLYLIGGQWYQETSIAAGTATQLEASDETWSFDPSTTEWRALAPVPGPISAHAAAPTGDGRIVVFAYQSTVVYDPVLDTWQDRTPSDMLDQDH